ncbi:MAG: calcium-binding protein, partial [Alphaproteobacteria bacterium]
TQADMIFGDNAIVAAADQAGFSDDPIAYYNSLDNAGRKQFLIDNQNGNGQTDNIDGGGGNDVILGGGGADQILGGLGDDIIHGGMGSDQMDGGTGADKFVFVPGDLSGGAVDTIYNFQTGAGGDALDIADLLSGYTPATKADYIKVVDDGSGNAKLQVDANGSAGGSAYVDVAVLVGVSPSTTVDDLINDGNLIVTH